MPAKRSGFRVTRRNMRGAGLWDWIKKGWNWVKDNKILSRGGKALSTIGVPYAGTVGNVAGALGLGRRRMGRGLYLAGSR